MKLYVARHGETPWNREGKICGATNVSLNENGKAQALELAEICTNYDIDIVLVSPMRRALATAQAVCERCDLTYIIDPRLYEMNFGEFEGQERLGPCKEDFDFMLKNPGIHCKNGESLFQVVHRIYSLLDEIKIKYQGKKVLLVCHGTVCRAIHSYFYDMSNEEIFYHRIQNCQLQEYEL